MRGVRSAVRADAGQAMAEYGIALAMASALQWAQRLPEFVANDPWTAAGIAAAVVAVVAIMTRPARG
jgi:ElaB/YqjD/DUF883 family membrane-anchored ribosome-binding protein